MPDWIPRWLWPLCGRGGVIGAVSRCAKLHATIVVFRLLSAWTGAHFVSAACEIAIAYSWVCLATVFAVLGACLQETARRGYGVVQGCAILGVFYEAKIGSAEAAWPSDPTLIRRLPTAMDLLPIPMDFQTADSRGGATRRATVAASVVVSTVNANTER